MMENEEFSTIPDEIQAPECAEQPVAPEEAVAAEASPQEVPQRTNKRKLGIIAGCVAGIVLIAGIVMGNAMKKQAAEKTAAEARSAYIEALNDLVWESLDGAAEAETMCNLTYMVWYDTIYEEYRSETAEYTRSGSVYHDDFNTSLAKLYTADGTMSTCAEIEANQAVVENLMKSLQSPTDEFEKCYDVAMALYSAYNKLTDLALEPQGSLRDYGDNFAEYVSDYMDAYDKLDLLIPEA